MENSGVSEERGLHIIGVTANNYYWCHECASTNPVPDDAEDVWMRGHTIARCSFCGRKLSEVPG